MDTWLYNRGAPDPGLAGRPLRRPVEPGPAARRVEGAARLLGRPVRYLDMYGFQREVVAAAEAADGCPLAYVESQARRDRGGGVEVAFHLLVRDPDGSVRGTELQTYNPFFGCEVGYLEWCGEVVVLIYREKHRTYACRLGPMPPAAFVPIADDWEVRDGTVLHRAAGEPVVRRLALPGLDELPPAPAEGAFRG